MTDKLTTSNKGLDGQRMRARKRKMEKKMQFKIEHLRVPLTGIAAIIAFLSYCFTSSYWKDTHQEFAEILFAFGLFFAAIASLGRMWCSLYIAGYKDEKLITYGPYSLCRNPLYFFSMLGVTGIGLTTKTLSFPLIFLTLFAVYYPLVIKKEELRLEAAFQDTFRDYKKMVPAFFPKFSNFAEPEQYLVNPKIYRKHMISAVWFIWIVGVLEMIEGLKAIGVLRHLWTIF